METKVNNLCETNPLFYNSALLFSEESIQKIMNAKVAVAGVGGIGAIIVEMIVRAGVNTIKLADPDTYSAENMNRQLYATLNTIGKNKAECAKERILNINPSCNIETFSDGVTIDNVEKFCNNVDIIIAEPDRESIKVLIHKVAKKKKIPCIMGSRVSIKDSTRWHVKAKVWDYRNSDTETFGKTNHPELEKYELFELTESICNEYDENIKTKKMNFFKKNAIENADLFKSITKDALIDRVNSCNNYFNRHVCSVIANTAGCITAALAIKYILTDGQCLDSEEIDVNLWK